MSKTTVGHFTEFVGRRIALRRKARKMTQEELAKKIGVPVSVLDNMEHGLTNINLEQLMQCARYLTATSDLLGLPHMSDIEMHNYLDTRIRAMSEDELRNWKADTGPLESDTRKLYIIDIGGESG